MPLESLANIELVEGPSQINREMAKRRIVIGINVRDRDLGGYRRGIAAEGREAGDASCRDITTSGAASSRTWSARAGT